MHQIKSMTGFTSNQYQLPEGQLNILIKSVNSRFLEIQFYIDDAIKSLESDLLKEIKSVVQRGKIDIQITLSNMAQSSLNVNQNYLASMSLALNQLKQAIPQGQIDLMSVLQFPGILQTNDFELNSRLKQQIIESFKTSVEQFEQSRKTEGTQLASVIAEKLDGIESQLKLVKQEMSTLLQVEKERLISKLKALKLTDISASRLDQEIVLLVQKGDIAEEYDRIKTHSQSIREILNSPLETNGKRLDFISQELLRESNTMAAKSASLKFSKIAIEFKIFSEQIREQVQNIE